MDADGWRDFGEWLVQAREAADMTQADLIRATEMSARAIQLYEKGRITSRGETVLPNPTERTLHRLADAIPGVSHQQMCERAGRECRERKRQGQAAPKGGADGARISALEQEVAELRRLLDEIRRGHR